MQVLLTGATGFLGGATIPRLLARGHSVVATGRDATKGRRLEREGVRFVPADLTDEAAVAKLVEGVDAVIHSAALSSPWGRPEEFERSNVRATETLVRAAERAGVARFVHISSPSVYASVDDQHGIREDDTQTRYALNDYVATKRIAERVVRSGRVPYVILRPRAIFGPGDPTLLPRMVRALETKRLPVMGDGRAVVDLTYVDNVAQAIVLALEADASACGEAYNVTNAEPVELWPLVRELCDRLGLAHPSRRIPFGVAFAVASVMESVAKRLPGRPEPILTRYTVTVLARSMTLDVSKARTRLGYEPEVSMREGIDRFVAWWNESGARETA